MTDRAADGDTHYEACEGIDCPCYLAGTRRTLSPFRTVDWNGNVYRIEHGNVATDAPTTVTLVPEAAVTPASNLPESATVWPDTASPG